MIRLLAWSLALAVSLPPLWRGPTLSEGVWAGLFVGLVLADAVLWARAAWSVRRTRRPVYWWDLHPSYREGNSPACAFCSQEPEDLRPWDLWTRGLDGYYRCADCIDVPEGTSPTHPDPLEDSARHADDGCAYY